MTIYINNAAMRAIRLRSDHLGAVDSIAHPLKAGRYHGTVWLNDQIEGTFIINVEPEGDGEQVDIDLAAISKRGKASGLNGPPLFSTGCLKDYPVFVMFHCDEDRSGFRVLLTKVGEEQSEFDSRTLSGGDYYVLTPLKPGFWKIMTSVGTEGSLVVEEAKPTAMPRTSRSGAMIRTDGKFLEPAKVEIVSGDGVVFEITDGTFTIEVALEQDQKPSGKIRPGSRFPGRRDFPAKKSSGRKKTYR